MKYFNLTAALGRLENKHCKVWRLFQLLCSRRKYISRLNQLPWGYCFSPSFSRSGRYWQISFMMRHAQAIETKWRHQKPKINCALEIEQSFHSQVPGVTKLPRKRKCIVFLVDTSVSIKKIGVGSLHHFSILTIFFEQFCFFPCNPAAYTNISEFRSENIQKCIYLTQIKKLIGPQLCASILNFYTNRLI